MRLQSEDVLMRVLNALHWDLAVPRDRLNVDVENGWVTVSGLVDLPYQRSWPIRREKRPGRDRRHQPDPPRGHASDQPANRRIGAKASLIRGRQRRGATMAAQTDFNIPPST